MAEETHKPTSPARSHLPNVLMLLGGAACIIFSWFTPEQSADLVNKIVQLIGVVLGGGGLFNATRVGVKQEIKNAAPDTQVLADKVSNNISDNVLTLNDTVLRMIGGMERIQKDFDRKHEENKRSHDDLKASLTSLIDGTSHNEARHLAHEQRFERLENKLDEVAAGVRKMNGTDPTPPG